ncbi:hypothetical protein JCM17844_29040 [Iodidimonas gelatinilytica]|uniref:DUF4167 domain-containing protein n=2 Tax=Iodidimonas gelatinilytica TaxID=1236966 RepID=A0A5A7MZ14_9PROT|nr:hypothetical protein JCM17844_29040 [Iodidimonas gelatinilytica]GER01037.1 hypothetical protein JCM17845_16600 [Iodidimonas gelatinilytica]
MARDAMQSGDRVLAEYYYQHADHYQRVVNERYGVSTVVDDEYDEDEDDTAEEAPRAQPQQQSQSQPRRSHRSRSQRAEEAAQGDKASQQTAEPASASEQTVASETTAAPDAAQESVLAPVKETGLETAVEDSAKAPTRLRRPPRRRVAVTDTASAPQDNGAQDKNVAADDPADNAAELVEKPKPRRRRKVVEDTAEPTAAATTD